MCQHVFSQSRNSAAPSASDALPRPAQLQLYHCQWPNLHPRLCHLECAAARDTLGWWYVPSPLQPHVQSANTHPDQMEVSLDVTTNGRMPLPPYPSDSPSAIHNISIFLSSYTTGRNFTLTNDAMLQEPGSTVKHVRFTWPDCLVGDGQPTTLDSPRGVYNVRSPPLSRTPIPLTPPRSPSAKTSASTAKTTTPFLTSPSPSPTASPLAAPVPPATPFPTRCSRPKRSTSWAPTTCPSCLRRGTPRLFRRPRTARPMGWGRSRGMVPVGG